MDKTIQKIGLTVNSVHRIIWLFFFFFFFFITFSSYPQKTQKQLYIIKKGKIWENPRKVKKKKKKFVGRLVVDFGLLVTDLITLYNIIIRYH
jgi:hypothetical protein